jgi:hypothetical protein
MKKCFVKKTKLQTAQGAKSECDGLFTNRLLWLGASAGAVPLRGSGCRNLALPGVYEQAYPLLTTTEK